MVRAIFLDEQEPHQTVYPQPRRSQHQHGMLLEKWVYFFMYGDE